MSEHPNAYCSCLDCFYQRDRDGSGAREWVKKDLLDENGNLGDDKFRRVRPRRSPRVAGLPRFRAAKALRAGLKKPSRARVAKKKGLWDSDDEAEEEVHAGGVGGIRASAMLQASALKCMLPFSGGLGGVAVIAKHDLPPVLSLCLPH